MILLPVQWQPVSGSGSYDLDAFFLAYYYQKHQLAAAAQIRRAASNTESVVLHGSGPDNLLASTSTAV